MTLTGAGGCGKTRLAMEVTSELLSRFDDGFARSTSRQSAKRNCSQWPSHRQWTSRNGPTRHLPPRSPRSCGHGMPWSSWSTASTSSRRVRSWSPPCPRRVRGCTSWRRAACRWPSTARPPSSSPDCRRPRQAPPPKAPSRPPTQRDCSSSAPVRWFPTSASTSTTPRGWRRSAAASTVSRSRSSPRSSASMTPRRENRFGAASCCPAPRTQRPALGAFAGRHRIAWPRRAAGHARSVSSTSRSQRSTTTGRG